MLEKNEGLLTLDQLKPSYSGKIVSIKCKDRSLRKRILDMGVTSGVTVTMIKRAPMGDPLEIQVRGYDLSIRKADASSIELTDVQKGSKSPQKERSNFDKIEHSKKGESSQLLKKDHSGIRVKTKLCLALAGNQNSGKTTLFNCLTGLNQKVGNFPGVTVEKKEGIIKNYPEVSLVDLPGIYSLSPYSKEEVVTRNFILDGKVDGIINIVDVTNLERNLLLTLQLLELNVPMVIALNMMDEFSDSKGRIDINGLEQSLGVPVVPISATKNQGIEELLEHVVNVAKYSEYPEKLDFCEISEDSSGSVHRSIHSIIHLIQDHAARASIPVRFAATKIIENDSLVLNSLDLDENEISACNKIVSQMEKETGLDKDEALTNMRFSFIEKICSNFLSKPEESLQHRLSIKADKLLTNKFLALPIFLGIMALIFYLTFGSIGAYLSDLLTEGIDWFTEATDGFLKWYGLNSVVHSLIIDGIFAGVGSVLSFLPTIIVLFALLSLLEDSGYMTRVAFVMDKILRKIGLSGRSFVPMLVGFGCSVPATMATRTLPSERDRKMTIFLVPFMSCSAKLPIYALFTAAFFKEYRVIVIISLYLLGILVGILLAYVMKFFFFKGEAVPFVMELPTYRMPTLKSVSRLIYSKSKDFVTRAFTIIFFATIAIWFLQNFDLHLNVVENSADSNSILSLLGSLITPIFHPLGISDWKISTAFFTGLIAKESVVSTLTVLVGGDVGNITLMFTHLTAFVFLVFSLLYTPCVAAIASVRRELGRRYAIGIILLQCSIAWVVAFIVYRIGLLFLQ